MKKSEGLDKKRKMLKRMIGTLLVAVLMLGSVSFSPFSVVVKADEPDKTITGLGMGAITNPVQPANTTDAWRGSYVYYGKYDGSNSTKYRVLDKASNSFGVNGGSLFLDCDSVLYEARFDEDGNPNSGASQANEWAYSDMKAGLNADSFLDKEGNFTPAEKDAIVGSTVTSARFTQLNGEKIFLLDVNEAGNIAYGYSAYSSETNNRKKTGGAWLLRTPVSNVGIRKVDGGNMACINRVNTICGVSPAFNLNPASIVFSSLISGTAGQPGAEYKLTLKDTALSATPGTVTGIGKTVTVPYSDVTGSPTQLSVVMTDGSWDTVDNRWSSGASAKYYGKLNIDGNIGTSGTGSFRLPEGFSLSDNWKTYLVAEKVNGGNVTDYAGTPVEFTIPKLDSVCNAPTGLTATYGQTLANVTMTNPEDNAPGTWTWADSTLSVGNAGEKTFKANFMPTDQTSYYSMENVDVTVAVGKAESTAAAVIGNNSTYDGAEKPLVTVNGEAAGGTMQYALGTATEATRPYTTSIPTATDAGTYYVWYKAVGDANHNDSNAACVTVIIAEKSKPADPANPTDPANPADPSDPSNPGSAEIPKDPEQVNAFVERMYVNVLKRTSDESGKNDWSGQLLNGANCGAGLAQGFILSKEFTDQGVSNEDFVDTLYAAFFDRPADDAGRTYWLGELANGRDRTDILSGFVNSTEFGNLCDRFGIARGTMESNGSCLYNEGVRNFVLRCYSKVLGRNGETAGIEDWCYRINKGELTMKDVAIEFLHSEEFLNKGLSNSDYVKVLYETFLDRQPDEGGLVDWIGKLESGEVDRDSIVSGFADSQEFSNIMEKYK